MPEPFFLQRARGVGLSRPFEQRLFLKVTYKRARFPSFLSVFWPGVTDNNFFSGIGRLPTPCLDATGHMRKNNKQPQSEKKTKSTPFCVLSRGCGTDRSTSQGAHAARLTVRCACWIFKTGCLSGTHLSILRLNLWSIPQSSTDLLLREMRANGVSGGKCIWYGH